MEQILLFRQALKEVSQGRRIEYARVQECGVGQRQLPLLEAQPLALEAFSRLQAAIGPERAGLRGPLVMQVRSPLIDG